MSSHMQAECLQELRDDSVQHEEKCWLLCGPHTIYDSVFMEDTCISLLNVTLATAHSRRLPQKTKWIIFQKTSNSDKTRLGSARGKGIIV